MIIFAASNGYLDDLQLSQCLPFEIDLSNYFDAHHKNLLEAIRAKEGLTDELRSAVSKAIEECKQQFMATQPAAVG